MPTRNYSNVAVPQVLGAGIDATATILTVSSTSGYPAVPFLLGIERGTANEEVVLCTALDATTFTVTRGYDGTGAKAHATGALVEHTVAAIDYREVGNVQRVVHNGTSYPARPDGALYVEWVGPTRPTDQAGLTVGADDTWVATA